MSDNVKDTNAFVNDDASYNRPIRTVVAPDKKSDIDLNNALYTNIINAGIASQLDMNALNTLNQKAENRNQMYNVFDVMCEDGSISAVVETYAEDATERNDRGDIVWVESSNDKVSQMVEYLLDTLNVNKNVYKWCHCLCKYGDLYLRLYRDSDYNDSALFGNDKSSSNKPLNEDIRIKAYKKSDNYVHYMEMVANPAEMFELTKFGKTVGYVEAPVTSTIVKNDNTTYNTFTYQYKFKKQDINLYPPTEFVHAALEDNISREEETVDIFMTDNDYNTDENAYTYKVRKGQSLLSNVYSTWRQLQLLENSVLLNRITKSSIIRLINVEVGDMPKENVPKTLLGIKQMVEQKSALKVGSSLTEYTNPGPVENNVYVPTHEGVGAITTTQIGGDVDVKSLADLDYYMNKLYGQLRVPKQYFSQTDDSTGFNGGSSLSIISSRYAKMIKRIQNTLIQAITDAINLMLLDKGLDSYVNEFTIHMLPPTTQEELDRRDNLSSKVQLTSDIMNMLQDVEDVTARLKIMKSLLTNVVTDNEIIQVIQDQIDELENQNAQEKITLDQDESPDFESGVSGGNTDTIDFNDSFEDEVNADMGPPNANKSADNTPLPSPDDLGVDLTDSDTE